MWETMANGKLDAWYEYAILAIISIPVWLPVISTLLLIVHRILGSILMFVYANLFRKL